VSSPLLSVQLFFIARIYAEEARRTTEILSNISFSAPPLEALWNNLTVSFFAKPNFHLIFQNKTTSVELHWHRISETLLPNLNFDNEAIT